MRNTFKKDSLKKITISLSLLLLCTGCGVGTWQPSREDLSKYGNEEAVYQAKKKRCIEIEDLKIDTESNSPFVDPTTKPIYESISSKEKDTNAGHLKNIMSKKKENLSLSWVKWQGTSWNTNVIMQSISI